MPKRYQGSCLCGQITYSVTGLKSEAANCHCRMCRKFHGAAFGTLVPVTGLSWLTGTELLKEYTAENGTTRTFCSNCESSIGFRVGGAAVEDIELAIATFDEDIPVIVTAQIYTYYKASWYNLSDSIKIYSEGTGH
ncbi:GFA family protein [Psychrobacter sp.]|uniref:GFA family protein n=1 Tax=Psychrobacter sp. TaxID=56811 RepID=UPI0025D46762|nr:GFA family protein [Psychrobacter sp.]